MGSYELYQMNQKQYEKGNCYFYEPKTGLKQRHAR